MLEEKSEKLKRFKKMIKNCSALQCLHCNKFIASKSPNNKFQAVYFCNILQAAWANYLKINKAIKWCNSKMRKTVKTPKTPATSTTTAINSKMRFKIAICKITNKLDSNRLSI